MKKPTLKQKRAVKLAVENGGNIGKAMRQAGYAEATAKNPSKLTESLSWDVLLGELSDDLLKTKLAEGLEATRASNASILVQNDGKIVKAEEQGLIEVPDFATRHKYIDTILKLKDKYPAEKKKLLGDPNEPLYIEVIEETKKTGIYDKNK